MARHSIVYTFYTDSNYVLISSRHFDIKVGNDGKLAPGEAETPIPLYLKRQ